MTDSDKGGILLVDKPSKMTSHDVVSKIRKIYGTRKVGHTGTLDPMATGLLCVLVGTAVKASSFITEADKQYTAEMKLGILTDTADTTGKILFSSDSIPSGDAVISAAKSFIGEYMQVPPMYSAIKVDGKKLYELAREGKKIELEPRQVFIRSLEITGEGDTYSLSVVCSKGTYIRTLCEDIGKKLGCGAAMSALRRDSACGFSVSDAMTPEKISALTEDEKTKLLLPIESLFSSYPLVALPPFYEKLILNGCEIYQKKAGTSFASGTRIRVCGKDGFIGIGEVRDFENGSAFKLTLRA